MELYTIKMAEKIDAIHAETAEQPHVSGLKDVPLEDAAPMQHIAEYQDATHINLTWKSWMVVFVTCFAIMAQV